MVTKPTRTSDFGVSRREAHDSSAFYSSRLYQKSGLTADCTLDELAKIPVPDPGKWADRLYCQSSEDMHQVPDNSIALAVTSPPYNAKKQYDDDLSLDEYLAFIHAVGQEVYRTLRPGGRYAVNIANLGRKPYIPLTAYFYQVHQDIGFLPMGEIIWQKGKGASGSTAWGSWMNARSPRLRDLHEYILVFAKQSFTRPDRGESDISREEFMSGTLSIWEIAPESAKRIGHPAPYPLALADRLIRLLSYKGDVVLDPFIGSGTTAVAALLSRRRYVGYDTSEGYIGLAESRILEAAAEER
ncbi:MAG: site-specific DNA-methyltransferase [Anaerolineales bacterium]|nr:site-specific DNA-methyltransferase [Anaerolineales bacterium]